MRIENLKEWVQAGGWKNVAVVGQRSVVRRVVKALVGLEGSTVASVEQVCSLHDLVLVVNGPQAGAEARIDANDFIGQASRGASVVSFVIE